MWEIGGKNYRGNVDDSMSDLGEIEVYLGSKFQSCFIDDFGMSGSLLQYWKYVTQI